MSNNAKRIEIAAIAVALLACAGFAYYEYAEANAIVIDPDRAYPVAYVVDGDTLKVKIDSHVVTVRLLGINTPETVDPRKPPECFGKEASDVSKSLLTGMKIKLAFNPNREQKDKYGRYLAYVYRDDGLFVNEFLVENGYAREYTFNHEQYLFQDEFRQAEAKAREAKKGLWEACPADLKSK